MNQSLKTIGKVLACGLCVAMISCDKPNLKDAKGKYSYAIGTQIAENMKKQKIELDVKSFAAAIRDVEEGKKLQMTEEERMAAIRGLSETMQAKTTEESTVNLKKGEEYLESNKKVEGVMVTKSGLQYKVVTEGKGPKPKATDTVEVHYRGRLIDGKEFDSSYARNQPAQFPVKAVIPGWTEALQLMTVGSKYELVIPAPLGYGERGNPGIPGNSVLVFDVELLKIVK